MGVQKRFPVKTVSNLLSGRLHLVVVTQKSVQRIDQAGRREVIHYGLCLNRIGQRNAAADKDGPADRQRFQQRVGKSPNQAAVGRQYSGRMATRQHMGNIHLLVEYFATFFDSQCRDAPL